MKVILETSGEIMVGHITRNVFCAAIPSVHAGGIIPLDNSMMIASGCPAGPNQFVGLCAMNEDDGDFLDIYFYPNDKCQIPQAPQRTTLKEQERHWQKLMSSH